MNNMKRKRINTKTFVCRCEGLKLHILSFNFKK